MIIIEKSTVKITNYLKVEFIDEKTFKFTFKGRWVSINGINLRIIFFDKEEIVLKGMIESVIFKNE